LGQGDFFGEAALLTGEPRNADVHAKNYVEVYSLDSEEFKNVLRTSLTFKDEVARALSLRK
jgi:CRP-like cAMP-binding protein